MIMKSEDYGEHKDKKQYCVTIFRRYKKACENPNGLLYPSYGARGIKFQFSSFREIIFLYERDKVSEMTNPYFVMIDNTGDLNRDNCIFIDEDEFRKVKRDAIRRMFDDRYSKEEK